MKPDKTLHVVWWLWLMPALLALSLPVEVVVAACARGLDSVQSSGSSGGGFALLSLSSLLTLMSGPPLLILSPLYLFLFWRRKERGVPLGPRFWVPIYGSVLIVVTFLVLLALRGA